MYDVLSLHICMQRFKNRIRDIEIVLNKSFLMRPTQFNLRKICAEEFIKEKKICKDVLQ